MNPDRMSVAKAASGVCVMSGRRLRVFGQNPEMWLNATISPLMMLFLFVYMMGTMAYDQQAFVDAQLPSILVLSAGFTSWYTAYGVNADVRQGIVDRFRSMPVFQPAVLCGHVVGSLLFSLTTAVVVIVAGLGVGFRPTAGPGGLLAVAGLVLLLVLATSWIAVFCGLVAKSSEGLGGLGMVVQFLPLVSAGFADPTLMPLPLRVFFEHQPFTPIIGAFRGLIMGGVDGGTLALALAWCLGIAACFFGLSFRAYSRRAR